MSEEKVLPPITIVGGPEPQVPSLAVRTRDRIREYIREFTESKTNELNFLSRAAHELDVLPLSPASAERWYGVRPDGDLLSFSPNTPYDPIEEDDLWRRAAELSQASERYPELEALVPPPPLSCRTCARCGGSGLIRRDDKEVLCICEGLGWLAPVEDKIEEERRERPQRPME